MYNLYKTSVREDVRCCERIKDNPKGGLSKDEPHCRVKRDELFLMKQKGKGGDKNVNRRKQSFS